MIKKISIFLFIFLLIFSFSACEKNPYRNDRYYVELERKYREIYDFSCFTVVIDEKYKEAFLNKKITIECFKYSKIKSIAYQGYDKSLDQGRITIYLKTNSLYEYEKAFEHFEKLDLVFALLKSRSS